MSVLRNIETRSHLLPWKSYKYCIFVCVFFFVCVAEFVLVRACVGWMVVGVRARYCACARVALLIQRATRRHIVICGLSGSITLFDSIS